MRRCLHWASLCSVLALWPALCGAQTEQTYDYLGITTKIVIGASGDVQSNFDQVLKIVGLPSVSGGASSALGIDSSGNVRKDPGTTIDTSGHWLFGASVTGPFQIAGGSAADTALGFDNVRCYMNTTPRCTWEDSGSSQWTIHNAAGSMQWYRTTSAGAVETVPLTLSDDITLNPKGKMVLPSTSYDINLGSPLRKLLSIHAAELDIDNLVAQFVAATIGGRVLVLPTSYLLEAITTSQTTIKVKHNTFVNGDIVYLESDGRVEFMSIGSSPTAINKCTVNCDADNTAAWATNGPNALALVRSARWQGDAAIAVPAGDTDVYHLTTGNFANSTAYTISIYIQRADLAAVVPVSGGAYQMYCRNTGPGPVDAIADDVGDGWYRLHATCTTGTTGSDLVGVLNLPLGVAHTVDAVQIETGSTLTPWSLTSSSYTVTRNLDGTGGNYWEAGAAIADTGQTGNGFIDIASTRGVKASTEIGPAIYFNKRNSSTYNDWTTCATIGQLNGTFGYSSSTFGAAFGCNGSTYVTADSVNGFRILHGSTVLTQWDTSGNGFLSGSMTFGSAGQLILDAHGAIRTVADSSMNTGTGFWLSSFSSVAEFRVGSVGAQFMKFDGTNFSAKMNSFVINNLTIDSNGLKLTPSTGSFAASHAYGFDPGDGLSHGMLEITSGQTLIYEQRNGTTAAVSMQADRTDNGKTASVTVTTTSAGTVGLNGDALTVNIGTATINGSPGATSTASCGAGQHVSSWIIVAGWVVQLACS